MGNILNHKTIVSLMVMNPHTGEFIWVQRESFDYYIYDNSDPSSIIEIIKGSLKYNETMVSNNYCSELKQLSIILESALPEYEVNVSALIEWKSNNSDKYSYQLKRQLELKSELNNNIKKRKLSMRDSSGNSIYTECNGKLKRIKK